MAEDVKAYDRLGNKITVPKDEVGRLYALGGRVATRQEQTEHDLAAEYAQKSTAEKAVGAVVGTATGPIVGGALGATGTIATAPEVQAFQRGEASPLTLGLDEVAVRKGLDAVGPAGSGARYAKRLTDTSEAHPGYRTAGELAGFAALALGGRAPGAARALPGMGVLGAGSLVEAGAARALGGLASRGAVGQAILTGGKLAARGAAEAGIYSGARYATEQVVEDKEVNGEKLFAVMGHAALGGAAIGGSLGFGGSLAATGARSAFRSVGGAILSRAARAAEAGESIAAETAPKAERPLLGMGERAGTAAAETAPMPKPSPSAASTAEGAARKVAYDFAYDSLYATKNVAKAINAEVPGGTTAVGEWVHRNIRAGSTLGEVAASSRVDEILPKIEAKVGQIGASIGNETKAYNVRVRVDEVVRPAAEIMSAMSQDATRIQGVDAFRARIAQMGQAFENAGLINKDGTMSLADLYAQRARMERVAYELGRGSAAEQGFRQYLRGLDDMLVSKMDDAARAAGQDGSKIRFLKREYQLGVRALEAAQEGANRIAGNNTFGIREGIGAMVGLATGHPFAAAGAAVAGKVMRERASAVGAHLLEQAASSGAVARFMRQADAAVGDSVRGVLREAPPASRAKGAARKPTASTAAESRAEQQAVRAQGQEIMRWATDVQTRPERTLESLKEAGEIVSRHAGPRASAGYTQSALQAIQYVMRYVPAKERRDPLDPSSVPPLTLDEAQSLVRAQGYARRPMSVFADFKRGIITPEGLDAANTFLPEQFYEFKIQLQSHVAEHLLRNKHLTQSQRLRIDKLLDGGAIRADDVARYQANFLPPAPEPTQGPKPAATGGPVNLNIQQSGFDAVEARKSR